MKSVVKNKVIICFKWKIMKMLRFYAMKYLKGGRQTIYFGQNFKQKANKFHSMSTNQIKIRILHQNYM